MYSLSEKRLFIQVQVGAWLLLLLGFFVFYWAEYQDYTKSLSLAVLNVGFQMLVIYSAYWYLIPLFLKTRYRIIVAGGIVIILLLLAFVWHEMTMWLYHLLMETNTSSSPWFMYLYRFISVVSMFAFSILLQYTSSYFSLRQVQQEQELAQRNAELDRLKIHIQPHFLFNTLNNIYYITESESPRSAEMLSRLSDMMRFFMDESQKQVITVSAELAFIDNYIDLENVRMRFPLKVEKNISIDRSIKVAPMLLIPFVENVFKHGIQKNREENLLKMELIEKGDRMCYRVVNMQTNRSNANEGGFGLINLRRRLELLFGEAFVLSTRQTTEQYEAYLEIPLTYD